MSRHPLARHFDNRQIQAVIEEAMLYMCACPAPLGTEILRLRELHTYQMVCISKGRDNLGEVHERLATAAREAHDILETCMVDLLTLEGWDVTTLKMPANLREVRQRAVDED